MSAKKYLGLMNEMFSENSGCIIFKYKKPEMGAYGIKFGR